MEAFKHNFKTIFGVIDRPGAIGYSQCLKDIYDYVRENTKGKTDNQIDALPLMQKMLATNEELVHLLTEPEVSVNDSVFEAMAEITRKYNETILKQ